MGRNILLAIFLLNFYYSVYCVFSILFHEFNKRNLLNFTCFLLN